MACSSRIARGAEGVLRGALLLFPFILASCEGDPYVPGGSLVEWKFPVTGLDLGEPSSDGARIFFTHVEGLVALDATSGTVVWTRSGSIRTKFLPARDGRLYLQHDSDLFALHPESGAEIWRYDFPSGVASISSGVHLGEDQLYAVASPGAIHALDYSGQPRWSRPVAPNQPVGLVELETFVCYGSDNNTPLGVVGCVDRASGAPQWTYTFPETCLDGGSHGAPAPFGEDLVAGNQCGTLVSLDARTGEVNWIRQFETAFDSSIIIDGGVAYATTRTAECIAFDPATGTVRWVARLRGSVFDSPVLDGPTVWTTDLSGTLYGIYRPTGRIISESVPPDPGAIYARRPVVFQTRIFTGGGSYFYGLRKP